MNETQGNNAASELVKGCLDPSPSEAFVLQRVQPDGSKKDYPLRMRLLSVEENHDALESAQKYAKERHEVSKEYGDIYKEAQAVEVVLRSLVTDDLSERGDGTKYHRRVFVTSEQLRKSFTENEIAICLNAYEVVKAKYRCTESFSPEEIDKWATRLSDTLLGPFFLSRLDSAHWAELMVALAERVRLLSDLAGLPLPSLQDGTASDQESSADTTGGSTKSSEPSLTDSDGVEIPKDHLLTKAEADQIAKNRRK